MSHKYHPFKSTSEMIFSALNSAQLWEESRLDAGCHLDIKGEKEKTESRIKAFKRALVLCGKSPKTDNEAFGDLINDMVEEGYAKIVTLEELKAYHALTKKQGE